MENILIKIHMDEQTITCLKKIKGKRLIRVGYIFHFDFSLSTVLEFEDFSILAGNDLIYIEPDEFINLVLREVKTSDYEVYESEGKSEPYEYKDYDMLIKDIDILHDYIEWDDDRRQEHIIFDIKNTIVIHFLNSELIINVWNSCHNIVHMFESDEVFKDELDIKALWPVTDINDEPTDLTIYRRTFERI